MENINWDQVEKPKPISILLGKSWANLPEGVPEWVVMPYGNLPLDRFLQLDSATPEALKTIVDPEVTLNPGTALTSGIIYSDFIRRFEIALELNKAWVEKFVLSSDTLARYFIASSKLKRNPNITLQECIDARNLSNPIIGNKKGIPDLFLFDSPDVWDTKTGIEQCFTRFFQKTPTDADKILLQEIFKENQWFYPIMEDLVQKKVKYFEVSQAANNVSQSWWKTPWLLATVQEAYEAAMNHRV